MNKLLYLILLLCLLAACKKTDNNKENEFKTTSEKYLRGVYGCNPSVVDDLADDSIIISYPIFERIFGSPIIQGKDSVKSFVNGFCGRWKNARLEINETVAENNNVVFVWSFSAIRAGSLIPDEEPSNEVRSWGGITLIQFNESGKIISEIGEESTPGPFERSFGDLK